MFSENAHKVLAKRYLARDEEGHILEDADGLLHRVATHIAEADRAFGGDVHATATRFYQRMASLEFLPNSPTLMNAGRPLGQLSACFVLPIEDSLEGIFDALKHAALIHQSGGGTGFSFSRLRPEGAAVRSSGGVASGPVSFMRVYNAATEAIKQGGTRRGANMGILRVDHPDILGFIDCKQDPAQMTNFNISVGLTEAFMQAVDQDDSYPLIHPKTGATVGTLSAKAVFERIVENAWRTGEPGIVFLDRINRDNTVPAHGDFEATNPCGEQPLLPYESCNLGSINLSVLAKGSDVDWERLGAIVDDAVHFLDNVIAVNLYPLPRISEATLATRKIGLGVMGWADLLYQLKIPYDSEAGCALAERVMGFVTERGRAASRALATVRGAFPWADTSVYANDSQPPRNATVTTIAPTGTISILADCASGVEPLFALSFTRTVMDKDALPQVNALFVEAAKAGGFYSESLLHKIAEHGTVTLLKEVPEAVRRVFVTAHDISPEAHVRMQAAFQKHTDNAVSKTVNFPNTATVDEVRAVYRLAWQLGLKGVTIYRDGSRDQQVLSVGTGQKPTVNAIEPMGIEPRPRPDVTQGITEKIKIGCGNLYVTVNYDEKGICEVFTNLGRAGGCPSQSEATSRLISTALRSGMDVKAIIEQLRGIRCHSTLRQPGLKVLSCPDAIGRVLEKVVKVREGWAGVLDTVTHLDDEPRCVGDCSACQNPCPKGGKCPECGQGLVFEGGCVVCRACGYSKCG